MAKRILIVDDEYDLLQALTGLLEDEGYDVVALNSATSALDYLSEADEKPTLILLDVMMPVISGLELLERLRAVQHTRAVPVVMMSAVDPPRSVAEQTCTAFLKKPFDIQKLLRTIERYAA